VYDKNDTDLITNLKVASVPFFFVARSVPLSCEVVSLDSRELSVSVSFVY